MADRFLGFDVCTYPGDSTVAWLWAHGFRIAGFYLNHHRGSQDDTWISRRAELANAGWGLAPIYLGWQLIDRRGRRLPPPLRAEATADADAAEAARLMRLAGFADGAILYLDLEDGTVPDGSYAEYVTAWTGHVGALGFAAGSIAPIASPSGPMHKIFPVGPTMFRYRRTVTSAFRSTRQRGRRMRSTWPVSAPKYARASTSPACRSPSI